MNRQDLLDAYDEFIAREPEPWYFALKRYTEYLQVVSKQLRDDSDAETLEPSHIPAADDLGISEGDVDAFLDRLWRQQDNKVSNVGQGMFMHTEWASLNSFTAADGTDLRSLTRDVMLDPAGAARAGRIRDFLEEWRAQDPTKPNMRWQVLWRLLSAVDPEHTTTVVAKPRLRKLAKLLGVNKPSNEWYDLNQQVLEQLPPTEDLSLRRVAAWHLITVMEANEKRASAPSAEFVWTIPHADELGDAWPVPLMRPLDSRHAAVIQHVINRVRGEGFEVVPSPEHVTVDAPELRIRRDGVTWAWLAVNKREAGAIHLIKGDIRSGDLPDAVRVTERVDGPRAWLATIAEADAVLDVAIAAWTT